MTEDSSESEMLRELHRETAALPREIQPPEEAWKKIKAQIDLEAQLVAMMPVQSRDLAAACFPCSCGTPSRCRSIAHYCTRTRPTNY